MALCMKPGTRLVLLIGGAVLAAVLLHQRAARSIPPEAGGGRTIGHGDEPATRSTVPFPPAPRAGGPVLPSPENWSTLTERRLLARFLLADDKEALLREIQLQHPGTYSAALAAILADASRWKPDRLGISFQKAIALDSSDPESNIGLVIALGYASCDRKGINVPPGILETCLVKPPRMRILRESDRVEMLAALVEAGAYLAAAQKTVAARSREIENSFTESLKKGVGYLVEETVQRSHGEDPESATALATRMLPLIRAYAARADHYYMDRIVANGQEARLLRALPPDTLYGDTGTTTSEAAAALEQEIPRLLHRYEAVHSGLVHLAPEDRRTFEVIQAHRGLQPSLDWAAARLGIEDHGTVMPGQ